MSKNRWRFSPSEIKRLIKAVEASGKKVRQVEMACDGRIKVITTDEPDAAPLDDPESLRHLL